MDVMQLQHGQKFGCFNCHLMVTTTIHLAATDTNDTETGLWLEDATIRFDPD